MPKIIWCGNKSWDTDFPENTLPNNAKRIERPDNIFKAVCYMVYYHLFLVMR